VTTRFWVILARTYLVVNLVFEVFYFWRELFSGRGLGFYVGDVGQEQTSAPLTRPLRLPPSQNRYDRGVI